MVKLAEGSREDARRGAVVVNVGAVKRRTRTRATKRRRKKRKGMS